MSRANVLAEGARKARSARVIVQLAVLFTSLVVACSSPPEEDADATVQPPNCATIVTFGNGQQCSSKSAELDECGAAEERVCANGWLCFDAARFAFCGCELDSDCQTRADYVNKARAIQKIAPLGAKCVAGRCAGAP